MGLLRYSIQLIKCHSLSTLLQYSSLLVGSTPQSYQLMLQCNLPKKHYAHQKRNVQINLPAYVLSLFQLFCCYPNSCSNGNEMDWQQSLYIGNHKFYTIKDKLGIYHCNSSCDLFCIAFQSEKIQAYPFQQRSNRRDNFFHYVFQNRFFSLKGKLLTLLRNFFNFWHS